MVESIFVYNLRKIFFQTIRFLQNHKDNYGAASCKPENSTPKTNFLPTQKSPTFKDIFQAFSQKQDFFLNLLQLLEFELE